MNCYEFEEKISTFIEGELKKAQKENFVIHKKECSHCSSMVDEVSIMLGKLGSLSTFNTSSSFDRKLQDKINNFENKVPTLWQKLLNLKPLGLEPIPALGFAFSLLMITSSAYFLLNQDGLPEISFDKISNNNKNSKFSPSVILPTYETPVVAEKDTSIQLKKNKTSNRIKLVGGK